MLVANETIGEGDAALIYPGGWRRPAGDDGRLRQSFLDGGCGWRCPGRPQFAPVHALRPLSRTAVRHGLHRAARGQSPQLALSPAPDSPASRLCPLCRRVPPCHRALHRPAAFPQPAALGPSAHAAGPHGFPGRARDLWRQWRCRRICRLRCPSLCLQPADAAPRLLQRRWRDAHRAATGYAAPHHRNGPDRPRAAAGRVGPARRPLPRRAAGRRGARLCLRKLRRALSLARTRADRRQRARQCPRFRNAGRLVRGCRPAG